MSDCIETGIAALDNMLGGGIRKSSTVLLRGAPGSGKTTIALQVMTNILKRNPNMKGVFVALETDEGDIGKLCALYNFDQASIGDRLSIVSKNDAIIGDRINKLYANADVLVFDSLTSWFSKSQGHSIVQSGYIHTLRKDFEQVRAAWHGIVVLTSEYDPGEVEVATLLGESYLCDAEILLKSEYISDFNKENVNNKKVTESRFFCHVLKSRLLPRQVRRCSYDFKVGSGVEFYETYPGDGRVVLFDENEPMKQEWQVFREGDIPELYPSLAFEHFDRTSMQRTFVSHRRLKHIPERTDLRLHSFDTYWVNWYSELCQRFDIVSMLRTTVPDLSCLNWQESGNLNGSPRTFSTVVGKLHLTCSEFVSRVAQAIDKLVHDSITNKDKPGKLIQSDPEAIEAFSEFKCRRQKEWSFCEDPNDKTRWQLVQRTKALELCFAEISPKDIKDCCHMDPAMGLVVDSEKILHSLKWDRENIEKVVRRNCSACCSECDAERQNSCFYKLSEKIAKTILPELDCTGLLEPIPWKSLRLFGERRSRIIPELEVFGRGARPVFRPFGAPHSFNVVGVPYNANIGFFAINQRKYDEVFNCIKNLGSDQLAVRIQEVYQDLCVDSSAPPKKECSAAILKRAEALVNGEYPQTWEEVIVLARHFGELASARKFFPVLLETKTYDSYMATFLEIFWSRGADFFVGPDYVIKNRTATEKHLLWTLRLFRYLFATELTRRNSSLEVSYVKSRMKQINEILKANGEMPIEGRNSWLFARHWYTTLVEILTEKKPSEGESDTSGYMLAREDLAEKLSLMRVPLSMDEYARQSEVKGLKPDKVVHHACWGEWYLAMLKRSENTALGIDLINNLMGSQKIADRAASCAAVPTVRDFYKQYGKTRCLSVPGRGDIYLPSETWNDLRKKFFTGAKSRTAIFDYRHCIRELHGVLEFVRTAASLDSSKTGAARWSPSDDEIKVELKAALDRIEGFARQQVLVE